MEKLNYTTKDRIKIFTSSRISIKHDCRQGICSALLEGLFSYIRKNKVSVYYPLTAVHDFMNEHFDKYCPDGKNLGGYFFPRNKKGQAIRLKILNKEIQLLKLRAKENENRKVSSKGKRNNRNLQRAKKSK